MKICPFCKNGFEEKRSTQIYCCDKCMWSFKNKKTQDKEKLEREKNPPPEKICLHCGTEFHSYNKRLLYCSKKCYCKAKAKRSYARSRKEGNHYDYLDRKICIRCNKEYQPTHGKGQKYCSSECSASARKKYLSIPQCLAEASRKLDKKLGYIRVYCPDHPKSNTWGYVYEHRLIMEGILGRYLLEKEQVHHLDGCRWNNSPDNLQVLSASEHSKITAKDNLIRGSSAGDGA